LFWTTSVTAVDHSNGFGACFRPVLDITDVAQLDRVDATVPDRDVVELRRIGTRPIVRTVNSRWPDSIRPPGSSMFCSLIAVAHVGRRNVKGAHLVGSTQTSTSRRRPPTILNVADAVDRFDQPLDLLVRNVCDLTQAARS